MPAGDASDDTARFCHEAGTVNPKFLGGGGGGGGWRGDWGLLQSRFQPLGRQIPSCKTMLLSEQTQ